MRKLWNVFLVVLLGLVLTSCMGGNLAGTYLVTGQVTDAFGVGIPFIPILLEGDGQLRVETDEKGHWSAKVKGTVVVRPLQEGLIFDPPYQRVWKESQVLFVSQEVGDKKVEVKVEHLEFGAANLVRLRILNLDDFEEVVFYGVGGALTTLEDSLSFLAPRDTFRLVFLDASRQVRAEAYIPKVSGTYGLHLVEEKELWLEKVYGQTRRPVALGVIEDRVYQEEVLPLFAYDLPEGYILIDDVGVELGFAFDEKVLFNQLLAEKLAEVNHSYANLSLSICLSQDQVYDAKTLELLSPTEAVYVQARIATLYESSYPEGRTTLRAYALLTSNARDVGEEKEFEVTVHSAWGVPFLLSYTLLGETLPPTGFLGTQIQSTKEEKMPLFLLDVPPDTYSLTLDVVGSGAVDPYAGVYSYARGTLVSVSAQALDGSRFVEWQGDVVSKEPQIQVLMDSNKTITAVFEEETTLFLQGASFVSGHASLNMPLLRAGQSAYFIMFPEADVNRTYTFTTGFVKGDRDTLDISLPKDTSPHYLLDATLREGELEIAKAHQSLHDVGALSHRIEDHQRREGDRDTFQVIKGFSQEGYVIESVSATLLAVGPTTLVWVEDSLIGRRITQSDAEWLLYEQENTMRGPVMAHFGRTPQHTTFSVLTPNSKTHVLVAALAEGLGGYFWAIDLYSAHFYPNSNERKIIYIGPFVGDALASITAHEFQHMLFFNEKVLAQRQINDIWINEAFSTLAQDVAGYPYIATGWGQTVADFLAEPSRTSLVHWGQTGADYGASYLFGRYLLDVYPDAIQEVTRSPYDPRIALALHSEIDSFTQLFRDWAVTLALTDTPHGNPRYSFSSISLANYTLGVERVSLSASTPGLQGSAVGYGIRYVLFTATEDTTAELSTSVSPLAGAYKVFVR